MKRNQSTDEELVKRFIDNECTQSFETLLRRYKKAVYTYILLYTKNSEFTDDLFQDVFIKVIELLQSSGVCPVNFRAWLFTLTRNMTIDFVRKEKINRNTDIQKLTPSEIKKEHNLSVDCETQYCVNQWIEMLRTETQKLPDKYKEPLMLRYFADLSFKEIAEILDISVNSAIGRLNSGLEILRKITAKQKENFYF